MKFKILLLHSTFIKPKIDYSDLCSVHPNYECTNPERITARIRKVFSNSIKHSERKTTLILDRFES